MCTDTIVTLCFAYFETEKDLKVERPKIVRYISEKLASTPRKVDESRDMKLRCKYARKQKKVHEDCNCNRTDRILLVPVKCTRIPCASCNKLFDICQEVNGKTESPIQLDWMNRLIKELTGKELFEIENRPFNYNWWEDPELAV